MSDTGLQGDMDIRGDDTGVRPSVPSMSRTALEACATYELMHFDLARNAASGQVFRWHPVEGLGSGWRSAYEVESGGREARFLQQDDGRLEVEMAQDADTAYWEHYLGLDYDYDAAYGELAAWPNMARIVAFSDGIRIINQDFLEAAVTFIISQNNNIPRVSGIVERLCDGGPFPDARALKARIAEDDCGLGYRRPYLDAFCDAVIGGWTPGDGSCAESLAELMGFKGIGEKVGTCICLYGLGHMDAHPVDIWIQRALDEMDVRWHPRYAGLQQQLIYYWMRNR